MLLLIDAQNRSEFFLVLLLIFTYRAFDPCVHGAVVAAPNPDERVGDLHGDDGPDDGSHERPLQQPLLVDEAAQEAHRGADHRPGCPADGGEEGASQPAGGSAGRREHLRRGLE